MRRRRSSSAQFGFTLVELLVALTILALMSMLAWRGMDTVLRSRDAAVIARDKVTRLSSALEQMAADVRSATSGRGAAPIVLTATGFSLERELAQANGPSRRAAVSWQLSQGALVRAIQGDTPEQTSALPVLPGVQSWSIAVFVDGQWMLSEEWLKRQQQQQQQGQQVGSGIAPPAGAAGGLNAGKIIALSIKLSMPDGEVVKVIMSEFV